MTPKKIFAISIFSITYIVLLSHSQFIAWPELTLWPYLTTKGFAYYHNMFNPYPPLLLRLLQTVAFFGWDLTIYRLVGWIILAATVALTAFITYRLTRSWNRSLLAATILALWQIRYEGTGLWFDHLLSPLLLLTFWFLHTRKDRPAVITFAASLLTKQTAIYALAPIILTTVHKPARLVRILFFSGVAFVAGLALLVPLSHWPDMIHQVYAFILFYVTRHPDQRKLPTITQFILVSIPFLTSFVLAGAALARKAFSSPKIKALKLPHLATLGPLLAWSIFPALGFMPRFELYHIQPSLGFLAITIALSYDWWPRLSKVALPKLTLFAAAGPLLLVAFNLAIIGDYYLTYANQPPRMAGDSITRTSALLSQEIGPSSFFSYNTWDHYYYFLGTVPAIDFIYPSTSLYFDYPGLQAQTVTKLEANPSQYILVGHDFTATLIDTYVQDHYHPVPLDLTDAVLYKRSSN